MSMCSMQMEVDEINSEKLYFFLCYENKENNEL